VARWAGIDLAGVREPSFHARAWQMLKARTPHSDLAGADKSSAHQLGRTLDPFLKAIARQGFHLGIHPMNSPGFHPPVPQPDQHGMPAYQPVAVLSHSARDRP